MAGFVFILRSSFPGRRIEDVTRLTRPSWEGIQLFSKSLPPVCRRGSDDANATKSYREMYFHLMRGAPRNFFQFSRVTLKLHQSQVLYSQSKRYLRIFKLNLMFHLCAYCVYNRMKFVALGSNDYITWKNLSMISSARARESKEMWNFHALKSWYIWISVEIFDYDHRCKFCSEAKMLINL